MHDDVRRSITNQIVREKNDLQEKLRKEFLTQLDSVRIQLNHCQQAINTLTEKLIQMAIKENDC